MYEVTITLTGAGNVDFTISPHDTSAFIAYTGPLNGKVVIATQRAVAAFPTGTGIDTDAAQHLATGRRTFYIPADGYIDVARARGITGISIEARKAYY